MEEKRPLLASSGSREELNDRNYHIDDHVSDKAITINITSDLISRPHGSDQNNGKSSKIKRMTAFVISCLAKFVTGAVFVFFVYQDAIKEKFNYSQKEVEVLASMMNIGLGLGFIPGMFFDRFGPRLTSVVGLAVCTWSYLLVWSTTYSVDFYKDKSWLMSIYFLLTGFGPGFTLMVAFSTNIMNFPEKHTGKIIGILNAFFAGSPSVFATLFYNVFTTGDSTKPENQDFRGFMFMIAIMFFIINVLNLVFVYKIPYIVPEITIVVTKDEIESTDIYEHSITGDNYVKDGTDVNREPEQEEDVPMLKLLKNIDYILFLLIFSFATTVSLVFGVNIATISKSVGQDKYNESLTIISPITNAVFSILIGYFSDHFKERIPRLHIIFMGCVAFTLCMLLVVVLPTHIESLMASAFLCGVGIAFLFSLGPPLMKEMFGMRNFGRNWGVCLLVQSAIAMPSQILFGAMYDNHVKPGDGHNCYGSVCIVGGISVFLGMSVLTLLLGLVLMNLHRCKRVIVKDGQK